MGLLDTLRRITSHGTSEPGMVDLSGPIAERPPWLVFPQSTDAADAPIRQGDGELYWDAEWHPFWASLTVEQKKTYLAQHHAPATWRVWLEPGGLSDRWDDVSRSIREDA